MKDEPKPGPNQCPAKCRIVGLIAYCMLDKGHKGKHKSIFGWEAPAKVSKRHGSPKVKRSRSSRP